MWTVSDFAEHAGINHRRALRLLLRINRQMGGALLRGAERGSTRLYTFVRAQLAKAHPEYFENVESLEQRVEELEDEIAELKAMMKRVAVQVGDNTRGLQRVGAVVGGRSRAA